MLSSAGICVSTYRLGGGVFWELKCHTFDELAAVDLAGCDFQGDDVALCIVSRGLGELEIGVAKCLQSATGVQVCHAIATLKVYHCVRNLQRPRLRA